MKWLGKLFGGSCGGTSNGRQPQVMGEGNMFWRQPSRSVICVLLRIKLVKIPYMKWQRNFIFFHYQDDRTRADNEELDRAIALSLAEEAKKRNGIS